MPAGFPSPAMDYLEERINLAHLLAPNPYSTFLFYCDGNSMIDACIPPGALLVVDKSLIANTGDIVIAFLNGQFTIKYIQFKDSKCFLIPANKKMKYPTIEVSEEMEMKLNFVKNKFVEKDLPIDADNSNGTRLDGDIKRHINLFMKQ